MGQWAASCCLRVLDRGMSVMLARLAALWGYLAALDPVDATVLAAHTTGHQRFLGEALAIVAAESRGRRVGLHTGHHSRVAGLRFYRAAVRTGALRLGTCEHHVPGDEGAAGWGIRGAHGNAAAYAVRYLGPCVAAEALDVPYLSAVVTFRRLRVLDRQYGLRTAEVRAKAWVVGVAGVVE